MAYPHMTPATVASAHMRAMNTFDVTATVTYAPMVVPPRCRKPRPVPETFTMILQVPWYTAEEAPVAARVPIWESHDYGDLITELRTVDGKFYRCEDGGGMPAQITVEELWTPHRAVAVAQAEERVEGSILIDGVVWRACSEPVYRIMTFGLGHNHGGTSVGPHIPYGREDLDRAEFVSALDYDEAVEAAVKVATDRGDDKSLDRIRTCSRIEVLIPEVFTLQSIGRRQALAVAEVKAAIAEAAAVVADAGPDGLRDVLGALDKASKVAWDAFRRIDL